VFHSIALPTPNERARSLQRAISSRDVAAGYSAFTNFKRNLGQVRTTFELRSRMIDRCKALPSLDQNLQAVSLWNVMIKLGSFCEKKKIQSKIVYMHNSTHFDRQRHMIFL
jgi:hypothetical protein